MFSLPSFYDLFWIVPGFLIIQSWNTHRDAGMVKASGWNYVFFVVTTGLIFYLGLGLFLENEIINSKPLFAGQTSLGVNWKLTWIELFCLAYIIFCYPFIRTKSLFFVTGSICLLSLILDFIFHYNELITFQKVLLCNYFILLYIEVMLFLFVPEVNDDFYNKCRSSFEKKVVITTKDDKLYQGILWKYPKNYDSPYELQSVSIIPTKSGYLTPVNSEKPVIWDRVYHYDQHGNKHPEDLELIINRSDVKSISTYSTEIHEPNLPSKN